MHTEARCLRTGLFFVAYPISETTIRMNYFMMGGPLFMGILTLVGIAVLVAFFLKKNAVKQLGLLALAVGVLGQMIGLFGAFEAIESVGGVSQPMLAGGLKVSSITTIYGLLIYVISLLLRTAKGWNA